MADSRRTFVGKALAAGGVLATSSFFRSAVAGDNCAKQTRILGFGASFGEGRPTIYRLNFPDWGLGDCELRNVHIDFVVGTGVGNFRAEVATHFTHHLDVWHLQLELCTGTPDQAVVLFDQTWHGPPMSEKDPGLFHPWRFQFPISTGIDLGKTFARVTSCC